MKKQLSAMLAVAQLASFPAVVSAQEPEPALRIGVVSDMQYGRASQDSSKTSYEYCGDKFKESVRQIIDRAGGLNELDVLMIPGDITHNSLDADWKAFIDDLKEVVPVGSHTKVMCLRGNHDAKPNKEENFIKYMQSYDSSITSANNVYDINGYKFIMVSNDTQRANDEPSSYPYIHSPETVTWFDDAVRTASAEAKREGKPVFVGMHSAVNDTVYGSFTVEGLRNGSKSNSSTWSTSELAASLNECSNVIAFSGHSHYDIANERSIHQNNFTAINTGAVNNMEIEDCWDESFQPKRFGSSEKESAGYYIEVARDNTVTVHRMDFYRKQDIKTSWVIDVNDKENWRYTDTRDADAPYFPQGATATVSEITQSGCRVDFTQAVDDTTDAGIYKMELVNTSTGQTEKTFTISSYYWQGDDKPSVNYWKVTGLDDGTTYKAVITAYDSFYQPSETTLETAEFTTKERAEQPAVITSVGFTNVGVRDTSEYAAFNKIEPLSYGTVPVAYNSEIKMYEGTFARTSDTSKDSPNFFKLIFDEGRRQLMKGGYTIDFVFSPNELHKDSNIIGLAQASGFDMEFDEKGVFSAYLRHNGAWITPKPGNGLTVETGKYYHITVTNNGSEVVVYNNGEVVDKTAVTGDMEFYSSPDKYYGMVIGGDFRPTSTADNGAGYQTTAQNAFSGKIVSAAVYSGALTAREAEKLHNGFESRKSLKLIDSLNEVLTSGSITDEELLNKGWDLMSSLTTTDEDIEKFLKSVKFGRHYGIEANEMALGAVNAADFGITADTSSTIWSVQNINDSNSAYTNAIRFSTRGNIGDKELMRITPSAPFKNGTYDIEAQFLALYKDGGHMDIDILGDDNTPVTTLRLAPSTGDYKYTNEAYFTDKNGNKIGKSIKYKNATDDAKSAASMLYMCVKADLINGTYSAYLLPRKVESGAYTATKISADSCLVENAPLNSNAITGMSASVTKSTLTNGLWLNSFKISGTESTNITFADGTAAAHIVNDSGEDKSYTLYSAHHNESGELTSVKLHTATVKDGDVSDVSVPAASGWRAYLWDGNMTPIMSKQSK